MSQYPSLYMIIDGERVDGGRRRTHAVVNPATGEVIGQLPLADPADLDRALAVAAEGFRIWRDSTAQQRAAVLQGAARLMLERQEDIARTATLEQGKPLAESRIEVLMNVGLFNFYAGEVQRLYGRTLVRPTGMRSTVTHEPVGPVAAFAPWNFPIGNPGRKLGAPIAAGCSVILKSAEEAPASALAVLQCLLDAGLPKQVAQAVFGVPDEVSRHLLGSPIIRKLSFTGSTVVGKHLARLATENMQRTTMELGGHGPVLVFDDVDVEDVLNTVVPHKYRNAGQVCVSPTRFYVQQSIYQRFVDGFAERTQGVTAGFGLDAESKMGPLANVRRPGAIEALVEDAASKGAKVRAGGKRGNAGFFFQPTLLADVPDNADIMNNEPFGPVAVAAPFADLDDAIAKANRLPYGLAAFAFTQNLRTANLLGDALESGMVGLNTFAVSAVDAPFGGVKDSGFGSEGGPEGMDSYLVTKAIHQA